MRQSRIRGTDFRGAVASLAVGGLLLWKPQIFVAAVLFFAELTQKALTPAIMSFAH